MSNVQRDFIFVGPSLESNQSLDGFDGSIQPPAACGDVYRAVCSGATRIGIIDGVFEQERAVWHKEILWALANGVSVIGAASMGALRAVELSSFGMIGFGQIFEWYRDGDINDDGEVAVLHAPAELGFKPLSEPLVNLRATLMYGQEMSVLTTMEMKSFLKVAKSIHYKERTRPVALKHLGDVLKTNRTSSEIEEKKEWLDAHWINQKHLDAVKLIAFMSEGSMDTKAKTKHFEFADTVFWHRLKTQLDAEKN